MQVMLVIAYNAEYAGKLIIMCSECSSDKMSNYALWF